MIESNSVPSLKRVILIAEEAKPGTVTFDDAMSSGSGLQVSVIKTDNKN